MERRDEFNVLEPSVDTGEEFNHAINEFTENDKSSSVPKKKDKLNDLTKAFVATIFVAGTITAVVVTSNNNNSSISPNEITIEFDQSNLIEDPYLPFSLPNFHDEEKKYKDLNLSFRQESQIYDLVLKDVDFDILDKNSMVIQTSDFLMDKRAPITYTLSGNYDGTDQDLLTGSLVLLEDIKHTIPKYLDFRTDVVESDSLASYGGTNLKGYLLNLYDEDFAYTSFHYVVNEIDVNNEVVSTLKEETVSSWNDFYVDISNLISYAYAITIDLDVTCMNKNEVVVDKYTTYLNIPTLYDFTVEYYDLESNGEFIAYINFNDPENEILSLKVDFYDKDSNQIDSQTWENNQNLLSLNGYRFNVNGYASGEPLSAQYFANTVSGEVKEITWSTIVSN